MGHRTWISLHRPSSPKLAFLWSLYFHILRNTSSDFYLL